VPDFPAQPATYSGNEQAAQWHFQPVAGQDNVTVTAYMKVF